MATLMREGGMPMWFLLLFGLATLAASIRFAARPRNDYLGVALALAITTAVTAVSAVASDLAAVGHHAPEYMRAHPDMPLVEVLLQGFAESMSPAILGFTVLALAGLMAALGLHRRRGESA
jgi:hypothetical protein